MNMYCELNSENHYNRLMPRVQQGKTRAKKSGYRPRGTRASQHVGAVKPKRDEAS